MAVPIPLFSLIHGMPGLAGKPSSTRSLARLFAVIGIALLVGRVATVAWGHGYHGGPLTAPSLDAWKNAAETRLGLVRPEPPPTRGAEEGRMDSGGDLRALEDASESAARRRGLHGDPTPTQRAQIQELVNVLAWLHGKNIIPTEFPKFDLQSVPKFRETARNMLESCGAAAVPALLEALVAPPESQELVRAPGFRREILELLRDIAAGGPDERFTVPFVERWVTALERANIRPDERAAAYRALFAMTPLSEMLRYPAAGGAVGRLWQTELKSRLEKSGPTARGELRRALRRLVREDPGRFVTLRRVAPTIRDVCAEALADVSCEELKDLYDRTDSAEVLGLLLEKERGLEVLGPGALTDRLTRKAILAALETGSGAPRVAATVLKESEPDIKTLKRLVSGSKDWKQIGAYYLLLDELPDTPEAASWLFASFRQLPAHRRNEFASDLARRAKRAATETLVAALSDKDDALRKVAISALAERAQENERLAELRRQQDDIIRAFKRDPLANRGLIPLLANLRSKAALRALIVELTHPEIEVWQACRDELRKLNPDGYALGPELDASDTKRASARRKWQNWLADYEEPP